MNFGSLINHEKHQCESNQNKKSPKSPKPYIRNTTGTSWNKGLTKESDERIMNITNKFKEHYQKLKEQGVQVHWGKCLTIENEEKRKQKISEAMKKNPLAGGKRQGSGRGKKGWYKGYFCDSSWELAYVIYNLEHDIKFIRNLEGFEYQYNNEVHKYYPDFILEDGTYVEVKGYYTKQTEEKLNSFKLKYKLVVIDKYEIKPYLEYVEKRYGKNFVNLYEK